MDTQQQNDEPKKEDRPDDGIKAKAPPQKKNYLYISKLFLGTYLFMILVEGSHTFRFYPELYDFMTYSAQLMSNKRFLGDSLLTLLGLLQLPFVILLFQALRRKDLDKYLTAKKLICIPWILEFFKTIAKILQEIHLSQHDEEAWAWYWLIAHGGPMLLLSYFFLRDKKIRESFQDEKRESPSENGTEEEETSVHLDMLNSYGHVIYKYWILISGVWTIHWLFVILTEGLGNEQDYPENVDSTPEIIMDLLGVGVAALLIWHILNCFLLFEAIKENNLKKIESSIKYMEIYSIAVIMILFFGLGSETLRKSIRKQDPAVSNMSQMVWTLITVALPLVWRIYYHIVYMYGAYKVRDVLKAHEKSKHNQ